MTTIQVAVIGITAVILAVQIKTLRPEYSTYLILGAGVIIAGLAVSRLGVILETIRTVGTYMDIQNIYLGTLMKMVGVAYISEFASGICKDAGFASLGVQVEMFGKLSILVISSPILLALLETLQKFMG